MTKRTTRARTILQNFIAAEMAPKKRRRRRRRSASKLLSARLITDVNKKKRDFLKEVSQMLTDALGFEVRVTLVKPKIEMSLDMRRASRMTKAQARRQMAEASQAPVSLPAVKAAARAKIKGNRLNDEVPF